MKFLSMFFVVVSAITVSAQIPTFGQYSNLRDQQFRILNGITIWSNYWDAARSAYVYKATINSEKQGKNGFCFSTEEWIEKDRRVVEHSFSFMLCLEECKTTDALTDVISGILKNTDDFVDKQDGYPLVASTPNVSYRGDSAKRIKELISKWCIENKGFPREIGFEWRRPKMYTLISICFFNLLGAPTIVSTVRESDTYIEFKGFGKQTHQLGK